MYIYIQGDSASVAKLKILSSEMVGHESRRLLLQLGMRAWPAISERGHDGRGRSEF